MSVRPDPAGEYRAVREQVDGCCFSVLAFVLVVIVVGVIWHYFGPLNAAVHSWLG